MRTRVRRAGAEDLPGLARLRASWHGGTADATFQDDLDAWWATTGQHRLWWVAETDVLLGGLVGMVNLELFHRMPSPGRAPTRWGYLANLYVEPAARGRGVGGSLLAALLAEARQLALARVVLSPSEPSRPLYARAGFRPADELLVLTF